MLLVEGGHVFALLFGEPEQGVLDQVGGLQPGSSVVQGLEDDLSVVLLLKLDLDQAESLADCDDQCVGPGDWVAGLAHPSVQLRRRSSGGPR